MRMTTIIGIVMSLVFGAGQVFGGGTPLSTSFTYQGRLILDGGPVSSTANFQFSLWDLAAGGAQVGVTEAVNNVPVSDGLFTVTLNFGADAFNGSNRWLQIAVCTPGGCGTFTTLSPRQPVRAAPYALQTRGLFVNSAGQVGINTETPLSRFTVSGDVTLAGDGDSIRFPDTDGANTPMIQMFTAAADNANRMVIGHSLNFPDWGMLYSDSTDQFRFVRDTGSALTVDLSSRFVGVRNNDPLVPLHVLGGTDAAPGGGGFLAVGDISAANIVMDNNEIMARNNGATSTLILNAQGGTVAVGDSTFADLDVTGNLLVTHIAASGSIDVVGSVNADRLVCQSANIHPLHVRRNASDGPLVVFFNDSDEVGTISVAGQNVSYNAFTGSHYGWVDAQHPPIRHGMLVKMTGDNRRASADAQSEIVYGIVPSMTANDPACLGAYLGVEESTAPASHANPHLIMAVGNGAMWVIDTGSDLKPGDLLISSDVAGCAMKDDPGRFPVGHVIARVGEPVVWNDVAAGEDGIKRALVSVLFESFTRSSSRSDEIASLRQENAAMRRALHDIAARLAALENR